MKRARRRRGSASWAFPQQPGKTMKLFGTRAVRAGSFALALLLLAIAALSAVPNYSARLSSFPHISSLTENTDSAVFSHDARGLESQYQPFLDAFAAGKPAEFHAALAIFALPSSADWFAKHFLQDEAPQLNKDYASELSGYEQALLRSMAAVPPGTRFHVRCTIPHPDPTFHMQPRAGATVPIAEIAVEHFVCEFSPAPKLKRGRFSMYVNYVYVDGSFRYIGTGAYPFWSAPEEAPARSNPSTSPGTSSGTSPRTSPQK